MNTTNLGLGDVFAAFIVLGLFLLIGRFLKQTIKLFDLLYLPESILAGGLALLLGKEGLGHLVPASSFLAHQGIFPENIATVWSQAPSVFINLVFATLFLGETIPSPKEIWQKVAPQVAFSQILAWGQYVVGLGMTLLVLTPVFGMNPIAGALIEMAFEGGHGTAAGMAAVLDDFGFQEGGEIALGLATVGLISGVVTGTILINWGRRKGHISSGHKPDLSFDSSPQEAGDDSHELQTEYKSLGKNLLIDPLSINLGFVAIALTLGWLILEGLKELEALTWSKIDIEIMNYVPLFPMALIGGLIVQISMRRLGLDGLILRPLQKNIAGVALDAVIFSAIASISLGVLGTNLIPFLILSVAGIAWNIFAFLFFAPRILPTHWFERGIGDIGQSMGVTATGLLLLQMVDPANETEALESFAYKQLLFEPIMGGGFFTAAAPILVFQLGGMPVLILTGGFLVFWIIFGLFNFNVKPKTLM
ncbi:sodium/glutamate symporter [Halothece sp. PCC 7418]|uniref:Glutamate transporter n=1 Tax=Aphanothece halophytica TaxID=72020 RepID=K0J2V5_APHHA|nr:sodium/glutamate symporter [Halothece sp. PCC 7418]AFZ45073.1 sodium/glutamate symporter [Halothece sp. PCC 7418]BAM45077.1 glutamate transporter [Aphanothece halophytica]